MKLSFEDIAEIIWGKNWKLNAGEDEMSLSVRSRFMGFLSELRSEMWLTPRPIHIKLLLEAFDYDSSDWTKARLKTICKRIGNLPSF